MADPVGGDGHRSPDLTGAAAGSVTPPGRRRTFLVSAGLVVAIVLALLAGYLRDRGWTHVASRKVLQERTILFVPDLGLFLVENGSDPLGLSARSPHRGLRLLFCRSSGYFQDGSGGRFDRFGVYVRGPASRGMDRVETRLNGDFVDVMPSVVTKGPARTSRSPVIAAGPDCGDGALESPAGFASPRRS
jgi:hypothetical protein